MFRNRRSKSKSQRIEFCDSCGTVCDDRCCAERRYENMKTRTMAARIWPLT
ncbi:MAG: hypothetical protein ABR505_10860 [Actinomycetota bacterium]